MSCLVCEKSISEAAKLVRGSLSSTPATTEKGTLESAWLYPWIFLGRCLGSLTASASGHFSCSQFC